MFKFSATAQRDRILFISQDHRAFYFLPLFTLYDYIALCRLGNNNPSSVPQFVSKMVDINIRKIYINFSELAPAHTSSYELVQVKKVEKVKKVKKEATFHQKLSLAKFPKGNQVRKCHHQGFSA